MIRLKLLPCLAGAIALTVAAFPLAVKAEPIQLVQAAPNQSQASPQLAGVEITPQQQQQLAKLSSDTRAQIEAVLSPQQQEQFKIAMQSRQAPQNTFANMKLSAEQQTQLQGIMQTAQTRAEAILTPEQRQRIQQNIQQNMQQQAPPASPQPGK